MCERFFQMEEPSPGPKAPKEEGTGPGTADRTDVPEVPEEEEPEAAKPGEKTQAVLTEEGSEPAPKADTEAASDSEPEEDLEEDLKDIDDDKGDIAKKDEEKEDVDDWGDEIELPPEPEPTPKVSLPAPSVPAPSPSRTRVPPSTRTRESISTRTRETDLPPTALTLARDVTRAYRDTSVIDLARKPLTRVQLAALLLVGVFFLGAVTTMTYAWRAYSWEDPLSGEGPITLQLNIQDDLGNELDNAQVSIPALSMIDDSNHGMVVLHQLPAGDHTVLISKEGYSNVTLRVTLRPQTDDQKTIILFENGEDIHIDDREDIDMPSPGMLYILAVIFLLGSLAAFTAASFSFQRIRYRMTLGCGVAAILSYGFLLGSGLALLSVLLLILAPNEFETPDEKPSDS